MEEVFDCSVIGGGVNGCAIAFQLAKKGHTVAILEMNTIASKSSGAAAGMLGAQTELTEAGPLFDFARKSRAMFPQLVKELEELSGIDIGFTQKGMYKVATTHAQATELHQVVEMQRHAGENAEWLTVEELRKRESAISTNIVGAMYIPNDGHVQASNLTHAYARSASLFGTKIFEFTSVLEFIQKGFDQIVGVKTNQGEFYAEKIVITSGAWSHVLLEKTGIKLPIVPVKGECVSVIPDRPLLTSTIFSHGCYIVPKRNGTLLIGATVVNNSFNEKVTVGGILQLLEKAKELVPDIGTAEWEKAWSGIRPLSIDGLPYMGKHPHYSNIMIATGHYRNGILLAPATGKYITDLVVGGIQELHAFSLQRLNTIFVSGGGA